MTFHAKSLFAGAAVAATLAFAGSVSAATIITALETGPFSLTNSIGTLPATALQGGNTYDFTFSLTQPLAGNTTSVQMQAQSKPSNPELIQYSLYSGTPGSGTLLSQSLLDFSPTIAFSGDVGDYYLEVDVLSKSGEVASGSITLSSAPEPATWAMMLVGFGGLGFALRRRAAKALTA